jgi:uncharacterized protein
VHPSPSKWKQQQSGNQLIGHDAKGQINLIINTNNMQEAKRMVQLGAMNKLQVKREVDAGYFLEGDDQKEILLPKHQIERPCSIDEWVDVFIYLDSEDRVAATTRKPLGMVNQFAFLKVVQVNPVGAFLDWGLPKDLLVPFHEQRKPMKEDTYYLVHIYLDTKSQRITASSRFDRFLNYYNDDFKEKQKVEIIIQSETDLGYKCIVEHTHWGILYENEVFQRLKIGQRLEGYIKKIRDDDKIDLCLLQSGYAKIDDISQRIVEKLKANDGFIMVNDKSAPEMINQLFGISKKAYKKAIGGLYKKKIITLEKDRIRLTEQGNI